jgi:hypothetical protein
VLTDERLDRGAAVHVRDRDDELVRARFLELGPRVLGLLEVGHVGHRAAGPEVREDHADAFVREDVGALGHEVDAAEDHVLDVLLVGGLARELEAVAGEVGELDDGVLLVVVAEDDESVAQRLARRFDAEAQLGVGELGVDFGKRLLPDQTHCF